MLSKANRESGMSIIELMISLGILAIIGTMMGRSFVFGQKNAQKIEVQSKSHDLLAHVLQKIRKNISVHDVNFAPTVEPKSLSLAIPSSSTSRVNYDLTVETRCRQLAAGELIDTSGVQQPMKACLDSLGCGNNAIPYIQWLRDGIELEQQPNQATFAVEKNKAYGSAGYGLCFNEQSGMLNVSGLTVNVEKIDGKLVAKVALEALSVPISKRNGVDLVPQ